MRPVSRIVAHVKALLSKDWRASAGARFRSTLEGLNEAARQTLKEEESLPEALAEGARRASIGLLSRDHAAAMAHYAEAEDLKISSELARRTLDAKTKKETEQAEQEAIKTRLLRLQELDARVTLLERLQKLGLAAMLDGDGAVVIAKTASTEYFERAMDLVVDATSEPAQAPRIVSAVGISAATSEAVAISMSEAATEISGHAPDLVISTQGSVQATLGPLTGGDDDVESS